MYWNKAIFLDEKYLWAAILCMLALFVIGEGLVRLFGFTQFPLYSLDSLAGYRMKQSQSGVFRRRSHWAYDKNGMRRREAPLRLERAVILIGDSIVDGGSNLDQASTICEQLGARIAQPVYPVAAPGWSLANALAALPTIKGWEEAGHLVLILHESDFDYVAQASSSYGFPTQRAAFMVPWLIRRHLFIRNANRRGALLKDDEFPFNPVLRDENIAQLQQLIGRTTAEVIVIRYPKFDAEPEYDKFYGEICSAAGATLIDLAKNPSWTEKCYRDAIHPNDLGCAVLADVIKKALEPDVILH